MIVQGGNSHFNYQSGGKASRNDNKDSNNFEDILLGAKKKNDFSKKADKKAAPQKKNSSYDINEDQQKPIRKEVKSQKTQDSKPRQVVVKPESKKMNHENQKISEREVLTGQAINKKFAEGQIQQPEMADSINLSGIDKKTLENNIAKNIEKMQASETPFQEMMDDLQEQNNMKSMMQDSLQGQKASLGQAMAGQKSALGGSVKIGPEMKMSESSETLALGMGTGVDNSSILEAKGGETSGQDSSTSLESMINQMLEQDGSTQEVDGGAFAEELQIGEDGGKAEKIENMQSIVKQARAFIDDGGGTMEIHLQPEGLGKVHLKVAVNDGQVNVEMLADNAAAKKALEEGLGDIKQALEGQKLLVETLKVEMSQDYQKDFSDLKQHMQDQANRDFAEQFLDQFQRERNEKIGGMFDAFRSFQPGPKQPELNLTRRNAYAENGKGRSVNLVA